MIRKLLLCAIVIINLASCLNIADKDHNTLLTNNPVQSTSTRTDGADSTASTPETPPADTNSENCVNPGSVELCVGPPVVEQSTIHVPVRARVTGDKLKLVWPFIIDSNSLPNDPSLFLINDVGIKFDSILNVDLPDENFLIEENWGDQVLDFENASPEIASLLLHIPGVVVEAPVAGEIEVDLGTDPRAGTVINLNTAIIVNGQTIQFDYAEIDSQYILHVYSEAIDIGEGLIVRWIRVGTPDGWTSGVGIGNKYDFETRVHHIWCQMTKDDGQANMGTISIPVFSAQIYVTGPFEIAVPVE